MTWCSFFTGLIPSLIGAGVGVLIALWVDRWRERRRIRREAQRVGQEIIEEIDTNITTLRTLIDVLEWMHKQAKKRLLSSKDFARPFARLRTMQLRLALERDLVRYLWKQHGSIIVGIETGWYLEDCESINISLNQFENYMNTVMLPLPDSSNESMWKITEADLFPRIIQLINQLSVFLERSRNTYAEFKAATGLQSILDNDATES